MKGRMDAKAYSMLGVCLAVLALMSLAWIVLVRPDHGASDVPARSSAGGKGPVAAANDSGRAGAPAVRASRAAERAGESDVSPSAPAGGGALRADVPLRPRGSAGARLSPRGSVRDADVRLRKLRDIQARLRDVMAHPDATGQINMKKMSDILGELAAMSDDGRVGGVNVRDLQALLDKAMEASGLARRVSELARNPEQGNARELRDAINRLNQLRGEIVQLQASIAASSGGRGATP